MEHTIEKGIYGEGNVWRFYTVEEAEQHNTESTSWQHYVERMKGCLGKTVVLPGNREYKIIGIEDNEPYLDYYWILENESGDRRYELTNFADFYKNIKYKELLLEDLCARLPYGVKITDGLHVTTLKVRIDTAPATLAQFISSENLKYYLRPMSSMTEEERAEYFLLNHRDNDRDDNIILPDEASALIDWLNKKGFDYRGLIPMGLALEATEGMYN